MLMIYTKFVCNSYSAHWGFKLLYCLCLNRAAIECEKKNHASNLEQSQIMEKNIISVARQIEKLRAEIPNVEKKARAAAAAAGAANPGKS